MNRRFSTLAIHGDPIKKDVHGSIRMPVYDSVGFEFANSKDIQQSFEGRKPAHSYSRITNPTVEDFETRMRLLTGGTGALAVSSGMAAISNVVLALAESGSNIVTTRHLFGNTLALFEKTLKPWGLEARYVDMTRLEQVEAAVDKNTRMVFLENITNPQLEVADFSALSQIAGQKQIPLVADCTMTTPYLFLSRKFRVDVEIISSTKYISGGATSVGGVIIDTGNFDWKQSPKLAEAARKMGPMALLATLRKEIYRNTGACLSAHNAYLQSLGLETLFLRVDKSCDNAMRVAQYLEKQPAVKRVTYPGLESSPFFQLAREQFNGKFGGVLTFDLDSQESCFQFMDALQLIKRATNINDNKSLIIHPHSTIFCEYPESEREAMGVRSTLMRLSVGIEDVDDIIEDLHAAGEAIA
jgi:O-acetylhomoserine (thiol)-lyase